MRLNLKYLLFHLLKFSRKFVAIFLIKEYKLYFYIPYINNLYSFLVYVKHNSFIKLSTLIDFSVVDWLENLKNRFELTYSFWSQLTKTRLFIKFFFNGLFPIISISNIFSSSNWLEREAWDMYGVKFLLNEDLRRILTDYGFKGHPLRKDFPLIGYIEIRYDDEKQIILAEPVEMMQCFRLFRFDNPWIRWK